MLWLTLSGFIVAAGFGLIAWQWHKMTCGIRVWVQNVDTATLRSVSVIVTGQSNLLGDMLPGSAASVNVQPKGESSVIVEFVDPAGNWKQLNAKVYCEPGYFGDLKLTIDRERIIRKVVRFY